MTITVEDVLEILEHIVYTPPSDCDGVKLAIENDWDRRFITELAFHTQNGKNISTEQSKLVFRMIEKYETQLISSGRGLTQNNLDALRNNPEFRNPPYQSVIVKREVRYFRDDILLFRCKYNPIIVEDIKKLKAPIDSLQAIKYPYFHGDFKIWVVKVCEENLQKVIKCIRKHHFDFDDGTARLIQESTNALQSKNHALVDDESDCIRISVFNDKFLEKWLDKVMTMENLNVCCERMSQITRGGQAIT